MNHNNHQEFNKQQNDNLTCDTTCDTTYNTTCNTTCNTTGNTIALKRSQDICDKFIYDSKLSAKIEKKYAYCTLIMGHDLDYVRGAIALARTCHKFNNYPLIIMITPDVAKHKIIIETLSSLVGSKNVRIVDYITAPVNMDAPFSHKQRMIYNNWMSESFTKYRCLEFLEYDKILFVDADVIFINTTDYIFEAYHTPAFMITNQFIRPSYCPIYDELFPCFRISVKPMELKERLKMHTITLNACFMLLSHKNGECKQIQSFIESIVEKDKRIYSEGSISGYDEQILARFYSTFNVTTWILPPTVCLFVGKQYIINNENLANIRTLHYYGTKPWKGKEANVWPDTKIWINYYNIAYNESVLIRELDRYLDNPEEQLLNSSSNSEPRIEPRTEYKLHKDDELQKLKKDSKICKLKDKNDLKNDSKLFTSKVYEICENILRDNSSPIPSCTRNKYENLISQEKRKRSREMDDFEEKKRKRSREMDDSKEKKRI